MDDVPVRPHLLRRMARHHPLALLGGILLLLLALMAIFAPLLVQYDPMSVSPVRRLRPPSERFWFGTDMLGRDVFSRVIYGARISLIVGFGVALLSVGGGLAIGLISGFNRRADAIIGRLMDGLMAIPAVLLAIAIMALSRASIQGVILSITIAEIPRVARLVRGVVLSLREQPFIEAARAIGTPFNRVILRHVLPNTVAPLVIQATYVCAAAILTEATLSFLGAGTPPEIPSWGNILADGRSLFQVAPHIILFPGLFLSLTVLAVNLLGDGLRDALDPRFIRRRT